MNTTAVSAHISCLLFISLSCGLLTCGKDTSPTESSATQDNVHTTAVRIGDTIAITLISIGPGSYGTPTIAGPSIVFLSDSMITPPNSAGPTQEYSFKAASAGTATITIPHTGAYPVFSLRCEVDSGFSYKFDLTYQNSGDTVDLVIRDTIAIRLQTIGPGSYGTPAIAGSSIVFLRDSMVSPPNPGGPTQVYLFRGSSAGSTTVTIPHTGANPAFSLYCKVNSPVPSKLNMMYWGPDSTVVLHSGDTFSIRLQTIGPGSYGTPAIAGSSVMFLSDSTVVPSIPAGMTQEYLFKATSAGIAIITIPNTGATPFNSLKPPYSLKCEVY